MNGLIWSQSPVVTLICNLQRVIIGPRGCVKLHSVQISRNRQVQVNKENIGRSMWYFPHETLSVVSDQSLKTSWMLLHNGGCSIAYSSHFLCQPATLHRRGCAAHFIGQFEASWIYTGAFGIKPTEGVKVVCLKNLHSANFNWLEFVWLACLRHVGYLDSQSKREAG